MGDMIFVTKVYSEYPLHTPNSKERDFIRKEVK